MSALRHIAVVSPRYAVGGTVGGAETLLRQLALRLAGRGLRVSFLTTCARNHFTWENEIPPGVQQDGPLEVHYFPVDASRDVAVFLEHQGQIDRRAELTLAQEQAWMANSVHSPALYEHLRTEGARYDRILSGPYLFGVSYAAALIRPERTFLVPCLHDEPFAYLKIMRELFGAVRGLLFNSGPEMELARRLYDLPAGRGAVVGMGFEPFEADANAFAARRKLAAPYVLYSGRRETLKGTPLLIEYVRLFRELTKTDLRLVLTGSGPFDAYPFVLDVGFVSEQEKHEAMAGARAFIHPSTMESLGIVLLEAFLARTPALVHAKGEVLRWQCERSGAGLWFRHYPDFHEELQRLLGDDALRRRLGEAGRQYVLREYGWPAVEARLLAALEGA